MNDDFEEDYDDDYDEADALQDAYDNAKDIKDKIDKRKSKKAETGKQGDASQTNQAKDFDKSLRDKNVARGNNPNATQAGQEVAKKGGQEAAKQAGTQAGAQAATTGTAATGTAATGTAATGTAAAGTAATGTAAAGTAATGTAAAGTAAAGATAGGAAAAGGAVAAQAAIPVAGWIALAIEAAIAAIIALKKWQKKRDEKNAENGVDSKGLRKIMKLSPLLMILAIFILVIVIIIVLIQGETYDRVAFLQEAVECFETAGGCKDFMNTKITIGDGILSTGSEPLIRKTDLEIAGFVVSYKTAEILFFGVSGSNFMSDIVNDINDYSKYGLDDESLWGKIKDLFQELVDKTIIGDIVEAWDLFHWLKVEKQAFNNIQWYKVYRETTIGGGGRSSQVQEIIGWVNTRFGVKPSITLNGPVKAAEPLTCGLHIVDGTSSWLKIPLDPNIRDGVYAIGLDEAINLAKPYLPNWIEIYATYVATGDRNLANDMYKYYKNIETEITLYLLLSITETEKGDETYTTTYHCEVDGDYRKLTESQYNDLIKQAEAGKGWWAKLKDAISDFIDMVADLIEEVIEAIKEFLGFYIKVDHDWAAVVTRGNAYDYVITQDYTIGYDEMAPTRTESKIEEEGDSETFEVKEKECDSDGKNCEDVVYEYEVWATTEATYQITDRIYYHTLEYEGSNIDKYDEKTRYQWIFNKIVEENGYKYTEDDVAMAIEVVTAYCSEEYGLLGNGGVKNFVLAGDMNNSVVNFATQFEGKKLAYMMSIDDTGIFFSNHWCAMFVSYCMKKAGVPIPTFVGCTSFWNSYKDQPGFYDIAPSDNPRNGGYITSDKKHQASYKNIQKGDILLWRWDHADCARSHTGIVVDVEKDTSGNVTCITTVEGNQYSGGKGYTNSSVCVLKYYPNGSSQYDNYHNIVSFISISEVIAEYEKGNKWKGVT